MAGSPQQHDASYYGPVTVPPPMTGIDHHTGNNVFYSLRTVCGFFNVSQKLFIQGLWDDAYGLSSLSEKTRKYNRLQMSLQRQHFLLSYLKTLSLWSGRDLNKRPPARQTGAYKTELTGRRLLLWVLIDTESCSLFIISHWHSIQVITEFKISLKIS